MKFHVSIVFLTILTDVWSFKLQPGLSRQRTVSPYRLDPLFSEIPKRKDLESLLGEAESADSEWLNSVFDTSMRDMLGSGVVNDAVSAAEQDEDESLSDINSDEEGRAETAKTPTRFMENETAASSTAGVSEIKKSAVADADTAMLYDLGYKDRDIARIKPKVLQVILESRLSLPSRGIPDRWLMESDSDSATSGEDERNVAVGSISKRKGPKDQDEEEKEDAPEQVYSSPRDEERIERPSSGARLGVPVRSIKESDVAGEGEGFTWKGGENKPKGRKTTTAFVGPLSLPTNRDTFTRSSGGGGRSAPPSRGNLGIGRQRDYYEGEYEDEGDYGYVYDDSPEIGGEDDELLTLGVTTANPFWPSQDEFQEMLLQESLWRINIIGKWVTPFVKAEAKWRNQLYEDFMYVLDEGLGDGFDTVAGETFGVEGDYYGEYDDDYGEEEDEDYGDYAEEEEEEEYEREFGDYYDDDDDDVEERDGDSLFDEDEVQQKQKQFPSNARSVRKANLDSAAVSVRGRGEGSTRSPSLIRGEDREGRGRGGGLRSRATRGRMREEGSVLWSDGDEGRAARARAASRYSRDLASRMGQALEQEEGWVDVDEVEREASKQAKRGLRVIKKLAKGSVPGQVYDALKEERTRIQSDPSYYRYDDDYDDDYDDGKERRRSRRRRGNSRAGRMRRRNEMQMGGRRSTPRGRRSREPSLTREALFGSDAGGVSSSKRSYYNMDNDDEDDFYNIDDTLSMGDSITSMEEYDAAYEASKNRAPRE